MKEKLEKKLTMFSERLGRTNALVQQESARALKLQGAVELLQLLIKEEDEEANRKAKKASKKNKG